MNWFQKHVNWTMLLVWTISPASLITFIILDEKGINNPIVWGLYFLFLVGGIFGLYIAQWGVRQKGRNLNWWLLVFVPFGFIVLLCLKNKRQEQVTLKDPNRPSISSLLF